MSALDLDGGLVVRSASPSRRVHARLSRLVAGASPIPFEPVGA